MSNLFFFGRLALLNQITTIMNTKFKLSNYIKLGVSLSLSIMTFSCTTESADTTTEETIVFENGSLSAKRTGCNETSFPKLGPKAKSGQVRGCNDVSNPNNIGTLDCRSTEGGYANVRGGYGRYKIKGSTKRFDGTRTRVERFFSSVPRGKNNSATLNYEFIIDKVSSGSTCIVQAHAEGKILAGFRKGQQATSAVFLLYVRKSLDKNGKQRRDAKNREIYTLESHESTSPYTTQNRGARTKKFFRNITQGIPYKLTYKTGYNNSNKAVSSLVVSGGGNTISKTFRHTYTTESVVSRYGAYEACDTCSDDEFQIRIKNTKLCRAN